jgi:hypothetical protein
MAEGAENVIILFSTQFEIAPRQGLFIRAAYLQRPESCSLQRDLGHFYFNLS